MMESIPGIKQMTDSSEILEAISYAIHSKKIFLIQALNKKSIKLSPLNIEPLHQSSFVTQSTTHEDYSIISALKKVSFKYDMGHIANFFESEFTGYSGPLMNFTMPSSILQVNRRSNMRLALPSHVYIIANFAHPEKPKQNIQKKILDISTTGFSIKVAPEDHFLKTGTLIPEINFGFPKGAKIKVEGEIRHIGKSKDESGLIFTKCGIKFKNIDKEQADQIQFHMYHLIKNG